MHIITDSGGKLWVKRFPVSCNILGFDLKLSYLFKKGRA